MSPKRDEPSASGTAPIDVGVAGRPPILVVIYGANIGQTYELAGKIVSIGRAPDNDVCIVNDAVSRNHAEIHMGEHGAELRDLRSTNGVYINNQPIRSARLRDGDQIKIGRTIFKYIDGRNVEAYYHKVVGAVANHDRLTGAFNHGFFDYQLEQAVERALGGGRALTLMLIDTDKMAWLNQEHGHRAGDYILREITWLIKSRRKNDFVARCGGDELAIICWDLEHSTVLLHAAELCALVQGHEFDFEGKKLNVTVSIGVCTWDPSHKTGIQLFEHAAQLVKHAKAEGRNRVFSHRLSGLDTEALRVVFADDQPDSYVLEELVEALRASFSADMDSTLDVRASTAHHKLLMAKQGLLSAWWYKVRWSWNSTRNVLAAETNLLALVRKKQELERLGFEISTVVSPNAVFVHRKPSDATIASKTVRTPAGS